MALGKSRGLQRLSPAVAMGSQRLSVELLVWVQALEVCAHEFIGAEARHLDFLGVDHGLHVPKLLPGLSLVCVGIVLDDPPPPVFPLG
eukprot:SAG31_NODE_4544_length_3150_cov_1.620125_5_plen_88_part_00